jgi:hypothetical protein
MGVARIRALTHGPNATIEAQAREALGTLQSAMNWLEDTAGFDVAHIELDNAGRFVRETFGCELTFIGGHYEQRCPVALAHVRVGLSVEMVIRKSECSICGRDPEECPHINGRTYDGNKCTRIIKEAELDKIAIVGRPGIPDARFTSEPVDAQDLIDQLGPEFKVGMPVDCDRCLSTCPGVREFKIPYVE